MAEKRQGSIEYQVLSKEKIQFIHEKSLELLESVGIKVGGEQVTDMLLSNGCETMEDGYMRIPSSLVEKCLELAPKEVVLYDRDGNPNMYLDQRNFKYFGSIADGMEFFDPDIDKLRTYTLEDSSIMCTLCDALDNFDFMVFTGVYYGPRTEVHTQLFYYNVIKNFSKTISLSTNDVEGLKSAIEISKIIAGGADKLAEKPFVFHYCEPIPPLGFPYDSTERIRLAADAGIPIVSMPYSMMGGTAPVTKTMALIQNNAEVLAGLVIAQLTRPGVGYIYGSMPTVFDMKSTIGSYAAPEFHLNINASAELSDFYNLPFFGTCGVSDAKILDIQCAAEGMMQVMNAMLGKQNIIHDIGMLDHGSNMNPLYLLFIDELIDMVKAYVKGYDIEEEDVDMDVFKRCKPLGHYMYDEHTMKNFKSSVRYSDIFTRKMVNPDESEVMPLLKKRYHNILSQHHCSPMDGERLAKLEAYLEQFKIKEFYQK
ncbi:Glycine betaine methyltransferase [Eubacterium callanderi]|uniref:trimethylamine methyltransferase family protein n=1 Tax=Eubacterium callanderi TaxID=53442 RepID=UPI0029FED0F6|nr:trimethylamine methyltransferase family protein [Eubacterium callanderi]WPK69183.1 Glycine betaine methyltransferase [Eubacterium callanderi]WPK73481.1 Glycine betaine methyltransferase [Eubacterium callanderi]